jgi:hypothetical protein
MLRLKGGRSLFSGLFVMHEKSMVNFILSVLFVMKVERRLVLTSDGRLAGTVGSNFDMVSLSAGG